MYNYILFFIFLFYSCGVNAVINTQKAAREFQKKYSHFENIQSLEDTIEKINTKYKDMFPISLPLANNSLKLIKHRLIILKEKYPELFFEIQEMKSFSPKQFLLIAGFGVLGFALAGTSLFYGSHLVMNHYLHYSQFIPGPKPYFTNYGGSAIVEKYLRYFKKEFLMLGGVLGIAAQNPCGLPGFTIKNLIIPGVIILALNIVILLKTAISFYGPWGDLSPLETSLMAIFDVADILKYIDLFALIGWIVYKRYSKRSNQDIQNNFIEILSHNDMYQDGNGITIEVS